MDIMSFNTLLETMDTILRTRGEIPSILSQATFGTCLQLALTVFVMNALYGLGLGLTGGRQQAIASAVKLPIVYLGTLCICLPVLIVGFRLFGSSLSPATVVSVALLALLLNAILILSFATITVFFSFSSSYHFMKLLHVAILGTCGLFSLGCLWNWVAYLVPSGGSGRVFLLWLTVFSFVGCQMSWSMRPLIGAPGLPFEWFRHGKVKANFYTTILDAYYNVSAARAAAEAEAKQEAASLAPSLSAKALGALPQA